jgi:hypothetical protein
MAFGVNDQARAEKAIKAIAGKRLTYHQLDKAGPKSNIRRSGFLRWRKHR